jgi:hypothetical protein
MQPYSYIAELTRYVEFLELKIKLLESKYNAKILKIEKTNLIITRAKNFFNFFSACCILK